MNSLRARLATGLFLLLTTVGAAAVVGAYIVAEGEPDDLLDDQLRQIAMNVGDRERPLPPIEPPIEAEDAILIMIRDKTGRVIRWSDESVNLPAVRETGFSDPVVDGVPWRSYAIVTADRLIQTAQRQHTRDELTDDLALQTVTPIALLIPLSWLVLGWLIKRLFRPLDRLTEELREAPAERSTPLSTEGLPSEVVPLVKATNSLLARQHELLELRKRFVSDAAHQLRTPLAALQLQAGNLAKSTGAERLGPEIAEMRRGIDRMTRLTSQLLDLARAEAPETAAAPAPVDLSAALRQAIEIVLPVAHERAIDLGVTSEAPAHVRGHEQDVAAVLMNVIDNAVRYAPGGGRVDVSCEVVADMVEVVVQDNGPGMPAAQLDRAFERFSRAGRSGSSGAGLGLAIVRAAAARSGMSVRLTNVDPPPGLRATIRMPIAGA